VTPLCFFAFTTSAQRLTTNTGYRTTTFSLPYPIEVKKVEIDRAINVGKLAIGFANLALMLVLNAQAIEIFLHSD
jgi:hypothetical protein